MVKIVAVSGGVDSMVLLDMCVKKFGRENVVVAHFDHCARPSSRTDRIFVQNFCQARNIEFVYSEAKRDMNEHLSEEMARDLRYNFFAQVQKKYSTDEILAAHHLDDLVESVAINLLRGTGWRGLAVMNSSKVKRPFLNGEFGKIYDRRDILKYAAENEVYYRQDPTNTEDTYMRNRVRQATFTMPREEKERLLVLRDKQCELKMEVAKIVDAIMSELTSEKAWQKTEGALAVPREVFRKIDDEVAMELVETLVRERLDLKCTRPQLKDFLQAIREYMPGKVFNLPKNKLVKMGRDYFVV